MPFVNYSRLVREVEDAIYDFEQMHPTDPESCSENGASILLLISLKFFSFMPAQNFLSAIWPLLPAHLQFPVFRILHGESILSGLSRSCTNSYMPCFRLSLVENIQKIMKRKQLKPSGNGMMRNKNYS